MSFESDQESLRAWFLEMKRAFPWREDITPYKVLVSEVMLQQTRADVVVDYFERWMGLFPTMEALAAAAVEAVLKAFEGLGYYSRARNLHKAAQELVHKFPDTREALLKVAGIGPYTADALLAFAFQKKVIAMDANVERVLSRYFATHDLKEAKRQTESALSPERPQEIAEGLIELGAVVCAKNPVCSSCPLAVGCRSFQQELVAQFPAAKKRKESIAVYKKVLLHRFQGRYGVRKQLRGELFADLYMFPEESLVERGDVSLPLKEVRATATCYRFCLSPILMEASAPLEGYEYLSLEECLCRPFSSGHRKILHQLEVLKN